MQFPSYIPEPIKQQATHYLEGNGDWPGWIACLKEQEEKLSKVDGEIAYWKRRAQDPCDQDPCDTESRLEKLRTERVDIEKQHKDIEKDVNCITRLVHDASMKEVYKLLLLEFFASEDADRKTDQFIQFAWSANINYKKPREAVNEAKKLTKQISKKATELASLLNDIGETGSNSPGEFFSIPALLESTDSNHGHNFHIWKSMKNVVLGNSPIREEQSISIDTAAPINIEFVRVFTENILLLDPTEQARNGLRYAWEKAPYLSELLNTVAKVADEFKPICGYFADTAISKIDKGSLSTNYLRGFAQLLMDKKIGLTANIINAMAITGTVVINNPGVTLTYESVYSAINNLTKLKTYKQKN